MATLIKYFLGNWVVMAIVAAVFAGAMAYSYHRGAISSEKEHYKELSKVSDRAQQCATAYDLLGADVARLSQESATRKKRAAEATKKLAAVSKQLADRKAALSGFQLTSNGDQCKAAESLFDQDLKAEK